MSTVPGAEAWRDAGLTTPDDVPTNLVEEESQGDPPPSPEDAEDYTPGSPRPDLDGEAAEADVVEQAAVVPVGEGGDEDTDIPGAAQGGDGA